jgi:hypothetical protein
MEYHDVYMLALNSGAELSPRNDRRVEETPQLVVLASLPMCWTRRPSRMATYRRQIGFMSAPQDQECRGQLKIYSCPHSSTMSH